ncbi:MAG: UDP-3-O-acyl-N-acetylglucosamine deacetylase [Thermoanaerobaculaceae bacterium]|nr:UDP-3-O-acyl-N-acetylglucosamine deacetylase [Thermoanaerobaculaceae bacterium]MDI9622009.1 UDP-3-O-acyl-N-acetylglucosamine deacetylase [Acidobacteriota bacterium]HPW54799.1 UDP-3-O-acyl-N-acetylglucosamine deacetylase [Thermoanaerobaculaceae bacterium]
MPRQATIRRTVEAVGFSGLRQVRAWIRFRPAPPGSGVLLRRIDVGSCVAASLDVASCCGGPLVLGRAPKQVENAEHLLAVVVALGLTDLVVELDGPEPPFFDGSAGPYFNLLHEAGLQIGAGIVPALQVAAPLRVESAEGWIEMRPSERLCLDVRGGPGAGRSAEQTVRFEVSARSTAAQVGSARCSPDRDRPPASRWGRVRRGAWPPASESVRHGAVELLGCLALVGQPLCAEIAAHQPTPELAVTSLRALAAARPAATRRG